MGSVTDKDSIDKIMGKQAEALKGFDVKTIDGHAGTVAPNQDRVDDEHLVVHVGGKLFGKDVVVETDAIEAVDSREHEIKIDRVAGWVKGSPKVAEFLDNHEA